jgi:predicted transcriptional regulator
VNTVTETLSIRLDSTTKQRLSALAKTSKRSASFLAAEAIASFVEQEEWQLGETEAAISELDAGNSVSHEKVAAWLSSWGTPHEKKAPR